MNLSLNLLNPLAHFIKIFLHIIEIDKFSLALDFICKNVEIKIWYWAMSVIDW